MKTVFCLTMFTFLLLLNFALALCDEPCWTEGQKLLALDGAAGDVFGGSVALSGDTAIVSAYFGASSEKCCYPGTFHFDFIEFIRLIA